MRHLLTLNDVSSDEIRRIFALTEDIKTKFQQGIREPLFPGRVMALVFEKQSLRTRVSFQAGMAHMGGSSMMLGDDVGFGKRERVDDFTRVLCEFVDVIVMRCKQHETVAEVAKFATCSVVNGLTDEAHPCQALADLYTIQERRGSLAGAKLAWVGDANNVASSLALGCGRLGVEFSIAAPTGYQFSDEFWDSLRTECPGIKLTITDDPAEAVQGASAVYTDVWASMGQEDEAEDRRQVFAPYQLNADVLANAAKDAIVMHCLPAHRGEEITAEVLEGPQSVVLQQAENRLHLQKALVAWLLGAKEAQS